MATRPRNTVIEGDDIQEQIDALPELMYLTRTNPDNPAIWETYNPKTGEIVDTGVFEGGGDRGLLAASRPVLALAASVLGAPYLSELIAGSTGLTGSALAGATGATIAGGSTALTGGSAEDTLRAALLGGGGGYLGNELNSYLNTAGGAVLGDASDIAMQMADAGKTLTEIETTLTNSGFSADVVAESLKDAANTLAPKAINIPSNVSGLTDAVNVVGQSATPTINNLINTLASTASASTTPALTVTGDRQVDQQTVNAINNALITNAPETVKITDNKPLTADQVVNLLATNPNALSAVTQPIPQQTIIAERPSSITDAVTAATIPLIQPTTPLEVPKVVAEKEMSNAEKIRLAQLGLSAAGLLTAGSALSSSGTPTGFDIVPIPETFLTPPKPTVAPFTPLPPINFGDRNLLIGTQWEKFLDPNYGKVPEPVQYSQPSSMSYNDLMSILGSRQGMPSASSLSINDIISGIQNQYGQVPSSTMG